jgi:hypothetical protein
MNYTAVNQIFRSDRIVDRRFHLDGEKELRRQVPRGVHNGTTSKQSATPEVDDGATLQQPLSDPKVHDETAPERSVSRILNLC